MDSNNVSNRSRWNFDLDIEEAAFNKDLITKEYIKSFLIKTQHIFKYNGLPDSIPQKDLEFILQCNGFAVITKVNGDLYALKGNLGGVPNAYYLPTQAVVSNPYLKFSKSLDIDKDCVVMLNDSLYHGLYDIIALNSNLLAECDLSFKYAAINERLSTLIEATNDTAKAEAEEFFKQVINGSGYGVIASPQFLERIQVHNLAAGTKVQDLIELKQYIYGTFCQQLGIQNNYNMKREAINEAEASLTTDMLYTLIDDMLEQRRIGLDKINAMYGTSISVELDGIWAQLREQQDLSLRLEESQILVNENNSNAETTSSTESKGVDDPVSDDKASKDEEVSNDE